MSSLNPPKYLISNPPFKLGRRRRATLRGIWWKETMRLVKHCPACGHRLVRKFVKAEKCWRRVCSSCGLINYFNPRVVAGTIPVLNGKVVLGRRSIDPARGYWTFPSGYVELGETSVEAAVRETWEEVSLRVRVRSLIGVFSYADAGVVTLVYWGHVPGSQRPKPTHETLEVGMFAPHEIPWDRLAFRSTRHALQTWIKMIRKS